MAGIRRDYLSGSRTPSRCCTSVRYKSARAKSANGGTVSRNTSDQSKSAFAKAQVVLIAGGAPARLGTFDQTGRFTFQDLAPGMYKLYAFESVPDGAWEDSEFMKEFAGAGMEIRLAEGEMKSADAPLISKSDLVLTLKKLGME